MPLRREDVAYLQRSVGNAVVALERRRSGELTQVPVQRNEKSQAILKDLATPQVGEGPAIEVQKNLVAALEARLSTIIASDAEKRTAYDRDIAAYEEAHKQWTAWGGLGWRSFRGPEPVLPPAAFGNGRRLQVKEEDATEFNLGGILIDKPPTSDGKDAKRFYPDLASAATLVPLDSRVRGARSSGTAVPELVGGLGHLVIENTLKTMIDARQFEYLLAAGLPTEEWKILVEVHYIRARPKDMAGLHKDTQGQTMFVNLNYHVGERDVRGPEYVLNPPTSEQHDRRIYGTDDKPGTLPKQFTDDLSFVRKRAGDPDMIRGAGTVRPYGYVAFVDEAIHHATPFFGHRYVTAAEFKAYLGRGDRRPKLDEITRAIEKKSEVNRQIIGVDEHETWTTWHRMALGAKDARYTRDDFRDTMKGEEFDRMLEDVGAQDGAERQHGAAGGWFGGSIPLDGRAQLHAKDKPPLVRQASVPELSKQWPAQLPDDVPRRFLRTWVRAVPAKMADELRGLR